MEKIQTKWLVLLHVVIFFFGVSAWLGINSTYVQLPLLVEVAPEQWSLPSFIVISIQIANIGPILYTTLQNRKLCKDSTLIGVILLIGLIGVLLFGFLYEKTAIVFGKERSVSILVLVFALALVGCTSSVLFMPYMGRFKEIYLVTYLIGEGASGLVPSIIALIQGVGGNTICVPSSSSETRFEEYTPPPRFGVQTFYNIIFVVFCLSLIAYLLLEFFPVFKHEYSTVSIDHGNNYLYNTQKESEKNTEELKKLSSFNYAFLLILLGMICTLVNGFFPSVQSYSCLPYGNVAYHLAVTLSQISNPLACFLAFFIPYKSIRTISYLTLFSMIFVVYLLFTTFMHPPPLRGTNLGVILVVSILTEFLKT